MFIEYLSHMLRRATKGTHYNFHPRCASLEIKHLAYADDLMLFGRADTTSVRILWECLTQFGGMSGLRANVLKSQMFLAGIQGLDRQRILEITGIPEGILPVRYLGIPLAAEGLRVLHYAPLLEKIATQIGLWTASSLSYAGRLELIRSVLKGFLAIHSSSSCGGSRRFCDVKGRRSKLLKQETF